MTKDEILLEERLENIEAFLKDLEIRFCKDIEAKQRPLEEDFADERLRALEDQVGKILTRLKTMEEIFIGEGK